MDARASSVSVGVAPARLCNAFRSGAGGRLSVLGEREFAILEFEAVSSKDGPAQAPRQARLVGRQLICASDLDRDRPVAHAWSQDGSLLAVATPVGVRGYVKTTRPRLWSPAAEALSNVSPMDVAVCSLGPQSGRYMIAVAGNDGVDVFYWAAAPKGRDPEPMRRLAHLHRGYVVVSVAMHVSNAELLLFCGALDLRGSIWRIPFEPDPAKAAVCPGGSQCACGLRSGRAWTVSTGSATVPTATSGFKPSRIMDSAWASSPTGAPRLSICYADGATATLDENKGAFLGHLFRSSPKSKDTASDEVLGTTFIAISPDQRAIASSCGCTVTVTPIGGGKATAVHHTSVPVRGLATLPEVSMLAVYDRDFKLTLVEWPVLRRDQGANTEEKDTDG